MDYVNSQVAPPPIEPLELKRLKVHLAIDHDDDDASLIPAIRAAREYCEVHTGRIYGPRQFLLQLTQWPNEPIRLPSEPVNSVDEVRYKDTMGATVVVASSQYRTWLNHSPPLVRLITGFAYPTLDLEDMAAIEVLYTAGEVEIPETLLKAMELIIGYWQDYPGGETSLPHLSRGIPGGAIRLLDSLWTGGL